jgi:hypothetical protein
MIEFAPLNSGDEGVANRSADVRKSDYSKEEATVIYYACSVRGESVTSSDEIHQVDISNSLGRRNLRFVKVKVAVNFSEQSS